MNEAKKICDSSQQEMEKLLDDMTDLCRNKPGHIVGFAVAALAAKVISSYSHIPGQVDFLIKLHHQAVQELVEIYTKPEEDEDSNLQGEENDRKYQ